ncbi:MAG: hypothetical protein IPK53_11210 [bacterium]|nr:hypothetical protein [bacterium]
MGFDQQSSRLLLLRQEGYQEHCKMPSNQPQRKALLGIKWPSGDRQIIARFQHNYRLERIVASEGGPRSRWLNTLSYRINKVM